MAGFVVFFLAGFVFGYAAPGLSAYLPVLLPLLIGLYTGLTQGFDAHVIVFTIIGVFLLIYWACQRGTPGANRFGPDPLQGR